MNSTGKIQTWPRNAEDLPASEIPMNVRSRATLSVDCRYRFTLLWLAPGRLFRSIAATGSRCCATAGVPAWGYRSTGAVAWLMLNPSTTNSDTDDRTITRCRNYTKAWGYRWLYVVNLSPFRATNPQDLADAGPEPEEVWLTNLEVIKAADRNADLLVAACGVHGPRENQAARVLKEFKDFDIHCLDTTQGGHPVHPLQRMKPIISHTLFRGKL